MISAELVSCELASSSYYIYTSDIVACQEKARISRLFQDVFFIQEAGQDT